MTTQMTTDSAPPLSEDARLLLGYLSMRGGDIFGCVAERNGTHYVIPRPDFNWDGRIELRHVLHPECLPELVERGLLARENHPTADWNLDYSPARIDLTNDVWVLTNEGKREGAQLLKS